MALGAQESFAQTVVVPNDNVEFQRIAETSEYHIFVCPDVACPDPGFRYFAKLSYSGSSIGLDPNMKSADFHYYRIADSGDVFNPRVIGDSVGEVGTGDYYLGIWIVNGNPLQPPPLQNYGWVHLRPVDGQLTMVSNAMSYMSRGIVIGTTIVVPESTTAAIAAIGLLGLLKLRVRR
jgi:hypothetical protein